MRRLVSEHVKFHGGLDVLVNSAGVGIARTVGDTTTKAWDLQQSVNLRGAFLVTRAALPTSARRGGTSSTWRRSRAPSPRPGLQATARQRRG